MTPATKKRCAWPNRPFPCDQPAPFRRPGSMLDYCYEHAQAVDANREAMFASREAAS